MSEILALFRNRNVARLWTAHSVSHFGDWVLLVALPVWVYQLTGSAITLGFLVAAETLPVIFLGPLAGVFVDRWERRRVLVTGHLILGINTLLLLLVTIPERMPLVFLVGFIEACVGLFTGSARLALIPNLVTDDELVSANSLFDIATMLPRLVGPAVGAALLAWSGPAVAFGLDAATFFFSAAMVAGIRVPRLPESLGDKEKGRPGNKETSIRDLSLSPSLPLSLSPLAGDAVSSGIGGVYRDMLAGLRVIRHSPILRSVLGLWMLLMFAAGPVVSLLVVFVQDALGGSATSYGVLESLLGLGLLLGFVIAGTFLGDWSPQRLFKAGLVIFAPLFLLFANAPDIYWGGALLTLAGVVMAAVTVADETILQQETEDTFRGRVITLNGAIDSTMSLISVVLAGVLIDRVGVRLIFNAAGVVCVAAALLSLVLLRETGSASVVGSSNRQVVE
jgi:MFS family permease